MDNTITICIPSQNPVKAWLQQCLDTCQGADEVIIGDDVSRPAIILGDYKLPNCITRLMPSDKHLGCFGMINKLVQVADTDFISIQADDDYYNPECLNLIIEVVRNTKADVVYFPCQYFGKYNFVFGNVPNITYRENYENNMVYGSAFFRRSVWEALKGFQLEVAADWDFWNRALKSGFIFEYVNELGAYFRVTNRSMFEKSLARLGRDKINKMVHKNCDAWNYTAPIAELSKV